MQGITIVQASAAAVSDLEGKTEEKPVFGTSHGRTSNRLHGHTILQCLDKAVSTLADDTDKYLLVIAGELCCISSCTRRIS